MLEWRQLIRFKRKTRGLAQPVLRDDGMSTDPSQTGSR